MTRVLVTGKDSQLAQCIRDVSLNYSEIEFIFKNSEELDITNKNTISTHFKTSKIDYCVNCAAYTAVDKAEDEPEKAMAVNKNGPKNLAETCKSYNVTLIHISTDFVFDGKKETPYLEKDKTNPINVYGRSKRDGENEVVSILKEHFIIRTSWLYSEHGNNFLKTILRLAKQKEEIDVVNNQIGSPTYAKDLANFILYIIDNNSKCYGIYNFSNLGETNWYNFASEIADMWKLKIKIKPISSEEYITLAHRPLYSSLGLSKVKTNFNFKLNYWANSLHNCFQNYN